jgi:hypothetical protein
MNKVQCLQTYSCRRQVIVSFVKDCSVHYMNGLLTTDEARNECRNEDYIIRKESRLRYCFPCFPSC